MTKLKNVEKKRTPPNQSNLFQRKICTDKGAKFSLFDIQEKSSEVRKASTDT
jgi:hypothetical protein